MAQTASGNINSISYEDVVEALGFTPADASAALENLTAEDISTALGFWPADASTVIHSLSAEDISTCLGYIPYDSANPNGYLNSGDFKTINGESIVGSGDIDLNVDADEIWDAIDDVSTRVYTNTTNITDISTRLHVMESTPLWQHLHYDSSRNAVYADTNFYSLG